MMVDGDTLSFEAVSDNEYLAFNSTAGWTCIMITIFYFPFLYRKDKDFFLTSNTGDTNFFIKSYKICNLNKKAYLCPREGKYGTETY